MSEKLTHYYCAQHLAHELDAQSPIGIAVDSHPDAFYLGAEGPDFFFFDLIPSPGHPSHMKYGSLIHSHDIDAFFHQGLFYTLKLQDPFERDTCLAYLMGFSVHHELDGKTHPFIYYHTGQYQHDKATRVFAYIHTYYEVLLDTAYLQYERGELATDFNFKRLFRISNEEAKIIGRLMENIFTVVFDKPLDVFDFMRAVKAAHAVAGMTSDPTNRKRNVLRHIEKLAHQELLVSREFYPPYTNEPVVLNMDHHAWQHPVTGETSTASYTDLFNEAVERSKADADFIAAALDDPDTLTREGVHAVYGNRSYLTDLDLDRDQTMTHFDIIFLKHPSLLKGF